jgi:hypothetical protein
LWKCWQTRRMTLQHNPHRHGRSDMKNCASRFNTRTRRRSATLVDSGADLNARDILGGSALRVTVSFLGDSCFIWRLICPRI